MPIHHRKVETHPDGPDSSKVQPSDWNADHVTQGLSFPIPRTPQRGRRGRLGPPGSRGPRGLPGPTGAQGPHGRPGKRGKTGRQGSSGPPGTPGARGARGNTGPTGHQGSPGRPGQRGHTGRRGPQGNPGPAGLRGPAGSTGANLLAHVDSTVTVNNTTAETDIFNFSIPGGLAKAGSLFELFLPSDFRTASGSSSTIRLRVYLGGNLYYDTTSSSFATVTANVMSLLIRLYVRIPASDQILELQRTQNTIGGSSTVGEGNIFNQNGWGIALGFPAENMATAKTLRVTITLGTAANLNRYQCFAASLRHTPPA